MIIHRDPVSGIPTRIIMRRPDNWHNHFRDHGDPRFAPTVCWIAWQFARATAMGNTVVPIITADEMDRYRRDILLAAQLAGYPDFQPLMVVMMSPYSTPGMLEEAFDRGAYGVKIMPAHGTTNSAHGIYDFEDARFMDNLRAVRDDGRSALFHAEVPDPNVEYSLREVEFIPILERIRTALPDLKICVEHVSDRRMVQWIMEQDEYVSATVTLHHMSVIAYNADWNPHLWCMPYPKSPEDTGEVRSAAFHHPRFFYGSDNAPHLRSKKECKVGRPPFGVCTAPVELPVAVELFEHYGMLEQLESFMCERGARWHNVPINEGQIELIRDPWWVSKVIDLGNGNEIVPYKQGQMLQWRLV